MMETRINQRPDTSVNREFSTLITKEQLFLIAKYAAKSKIDAMHEDLNDSLHKYNITTPFRIAHFLAQVIHESGSFRYMQEIASGEAYEGRKDLGNTEPGDGKKFKGRGLIQLTGRANYKEYGEDIGQDLTANPEKVAEFPLAIDVAGWYWSTRGLNQYADQDDVRAVTRRINGGYNGLDDRIKYLEIAKKVLGVE